MKKDNWTGERLETHIQNTNTIEHLHRYALAIYLAKSKIVLDIASGEGYGSNLLSNVAEKVIGVDISSEAITIATKKYKKDNLEFKVGSTSAIPLDNNSVDLIVSFETIEHHDEHLEMLKEIKRVLKPDGILIISSPDKKEYSDKTGYCNKFHIKELYQDDFKKLITDHFIHYSFLNQRFLFGSVIQPQENSKFLNFYDGSYNEITETTFEPFYNLAIASDAKLKEFNTSMFISQNAFQEIEQATAEKYITSTTWKLGRFIMKPLEYIKSIF